MHTQPDWISFIAPFVHREEDIINGGRRLDESEDGRINWEINKRKSVEGSFSSTVSVKSVDFFNELAPFDSVNGALKRFDKMLPAGVAEDVLLKTPWREENREKLFLVEISGNPTKFFQGHNVFADGNVDIAVICQMMACDIFARMGLVPSAEDMVRWSLGYFKISRIDGNINLQVNDPEKVNAVVNTLNKTVTNRASKSCHFRNNRGGSTVSFGSNGYKKVQFYDKYAEQIKAGHGPVEDLDYRDEILEEAKGVIRFETRFGGEWFSKKKELQYACDWEFGTLAELVKQEFDNLDIGVNNILNGKAMDKLLETLPGHLVRTALLWKGGLFAKELRLVLAQIASQGIVKRF